MKDKERLKKIHKRNAKALGKIENFIQKLDLTKKEKLYINKYLIRVKGECDNLIGYTNPEIKDNTIWYYGKFRK